MSVPYICPVATSYVHRESLGKKVSFRCVCLMQFKQILSKWIKEIIFLFNYLKTGGDNAKQKQEESSMCGNLTQYVELIVVSYADLTYQIFNEWIHVVPECEWSHIILSVTF